MEDKKSAASRFPADADATAVPVVCRGYSPYTALERRTTVVRAATGGTAAAAGAPAAAAKEMQRVATEKLRSAIERAATAPNERTLPTGRVFWGSFTCAALSGANYAFIASGVPLAIPKIAAEFDAAGVISLLGSIAVCAAVGAGPMFAVAADVFGRRWVAVTAAATVSLFAVLLAVSTSSIWLVITWRGLMGVSGAGIYLFTPLVIAEIVSVAQRGTWLGVASVVSGTFGMIAPVLCGYYADGPGWRWVFYTIAILCAVVALCYVFLFTETLPPEDARALLDSDADVSAEGPPTKTPSRLAAMLSTIDWGGSFLWFAGSFSLLIGLNIGGGGLKTFNNPAVIALLCAGGVLLACFLLYEGKFAKHPLIPLSFFSTRNFNSISAFSFLSGAIGAGYPFIFPTWAQAVFGVNGTTTGTWTLPGSILIMAVSLGTGFLVQKSGRTRELIWVACLFACFATILPIFATASTSWMALVSQVAYGTAFGAFKVVPAVVAQLSVPPESIAQATAVRSSLYFAGGSAGITVLSLIPVVVARGVLDAQLPELLASFGWPVEVQAALLATYYASGFPAMMSQLTTGYPDLAQPGPVSGLDAANYAARRQGFSAAWIAAAGIMGAASLCSLLLRHIPLAGDRREAVARRCCSLAANLEPSCSFSHTAA